MRIFILLSFLAFSLSAFARCDQSALVIRRGTSIGFSTGSRGNSNFNQNLTVNIPMQFNGRSACYHQQSSLGVTTKRVRRGHSVEYEITPMRASFENVPDAHHQQYLFMEYGSDGKASKVYMMSFLCSGETPLGSETFSDFLSLIPDGSRSSVQVSTVFATGAAARNLQQDRPDDRARPVYEKFHSLYRNLQGEESSSDCAACRDRVFIPSVIATTSINSYSDIDRNLYASFYSRTQSSLNGCAADFRERMQAYRIENLLRTNPLPGIQIRGSGSNNYRMRWSLR